MEEKMNKIRLPILITTVSLVLTAILVLQAYQRSIGVQGKGVSKMTGMGDLRRFEGQQAALNTWVSAADRVGMSDLHRFEGQQAALNTWVSAADRVGMGDLHRFEDAAPSSSPSPARVCPSLSTLSGERDAGASAPAYVLRALGCPVPAGQ
jgi:hypothetical protein